MKNTKQNTIIISILVLTIVVIGLSVQRYQAEKNNTDLPSVHYVLADFPDATRLNTAEDAQLLVDRLNNETSHIGEEGFSDFGLLLNIGAFKKALNDYTGAEETWLNAIALNPESVVPHGNLADLYLFFMDRPDDAIASYEKAISLDNQNYNYYEGLATVYRFKKTDQIDKVEEIMTNAADLNNFQRLNYYLYLIDFFDTDGNDKAKASLYARRSLELDPPEEVRQVLLEYE